MESITHLSASVAELHLHSQNVPQAQTTLTTITHPSGFFQKESKEFHVSHLIKLLADESSASDSLEDLEIFYDSILSHFNMIALTAELFPTYRDLPKSFNFYQHLAQQDRTIRPSQENTIQVMANYKSFGSGIHKFLLDPKTIPQGTCPDSYLQFLSLQNELDGFLILKNFIFLHSPQLNGKLRDFRSMVTNLSITPGEHIRAFYGRAIWLGNEISLANMPDGTLAVLHGRFILLLCDTNCSLIIGETSAYWRQIHEHHREPTKLLADIPWTFNEVLCSLETAGIETLSTTNNNILSLNL
jgi:hypothetical protein